MAATDPRLMGMLGVQQRLMAQHGVEGPSRPAAPRPIMPAAMARATALHDRHATKVRRATAARHGSKQSAAAARVAGCGRWARGKAQAAQEIRKAAAGPHAVAVKRKRPHQTRASSCSSMVGRWTSRTNRYRCYACR